MRLLVLLLLSLSLLALPSHAEEFVADGYDASQLTPEMLTQTNTIAAALEGLAIEGWTPQGGVERYTHINMYGKINGRSELFMSYGVIGMTWLGLTNAADPDKTIDVFLYDMASPLGAFGVYAVERWEESEPMKVGTEGYRTDTDLFFRKGRYYATFIGSAEDDAIKLAQHTMGTKLAQRLADDPALLWGEAALPAENRVKDSLKYFKVDAMSLDFLKNTFTCEVTIGGAPITHFVSRQDSDAAATQAIAAYEKYLSAYGSKAETVETEAGPMLVGDAGGGYFDIVFTLGKNVAGVTAVKDKAVALSAAAALKAHLENTAK